MESTEVPGTSIAAVVPEPSPLPPSDSDIDLLLPQVPLFALIIGINEYTNCTKLSGAVSDAKAIKEYLKEFLRVSDDHIHTLLDEQATRDAIIKAFQSLRDDPRIQNGDPIVIFYAGHGAELPAPRSWNLYGGKIQCLLPYDFKHEVNTTNYKEPASTHPIPDRSIGCLLEDIAKAKGDNITIILDCCHSASGTRHEDNTYVPRTVIPSLTYDIPEKLDNSIWGNRTGQIPEALAYYGLKSHVLLAACGEKELAYEHGGHGQFTTQLLSTLKAFSLLDLTYFDLLWRIKLSITKQLPRCEGRNRHRVLFNAKVSASRQVRYSVKPLGIKYVLSAGLAHGVSHGVEFTIYSDSEQRESPPVIAVDDTAVIGDFETTVTTSVVFVSDSYARLTRVGKVPFYLSPEPNLSPFLLGGGERANFRLVEKVEEAKLEVVVEDQKAVFNIRDRRVNEFGLTRLAHKAILQASNIARVLSAAAHYYWFLDLTNKNSGIQTRRPVSVDFYRLIDEYDEYGVPLRIPQEPGFCRPDPNPDNSDVIDFVIQPRALYGFNIKNNTPRDLYLNAFLFNCNNLSVESYYIPEYDMDPNIYPAPLKGDGEFQIGYGPGGATPFRYALEDDQDVDVGYLKIFFSTRPIDLSDIVQRPRFSNDTKDGREDEIARAAKQVQVNQTLTGSVPTTDTWFTVQIPVVQRRKSMSKAL